MNRLVLIGNGFDLAHGLKTSYKDFITNYLCRILNIFYQKHTYEDCLIKIKYHNVGVPLNAKIVKPIFKELIEEIQLIRSSNYPKINFEYKSILFHSLIFNCSECNWVDIEIEYFEKLKNCKSNGKFNYNQVEKLNIELDFLKKELEEYLNSVDQNLTLNLNNEYDKIFCNAILGEEIYPQLVSKQKLDNLYILNFNYTSTSKAYYNKYKSKINTSHNHIHGEILKNENPIIFGFGDEHDKDYKDFEEYKNHSLFKHIKSFGYFKTKNYRNLLSFIDSDTYQVCIIGHSCGLSDRTLLKQIFEHTNCASIKIYHHNDYIEKTYEIARHFSDKTVMRQKIVQYDSMNFVPQGSHTLIKKVT